MQNDCLVNVPHYMSHMKGKIPEFFFKRKTVRSKAASTLSDSAPSFPFDMANTNETLVTNNKTMQSNCHVSVPYYMFHTKDTLTLV